MATRRRSRELSAADRERLKLSPEIAWFLRDRGIAYPDCPPRWKTPEPGEVDRDAVFDPARVDRVLAAFSQLRHTKGQWAGRPLTPDPWQVAYILAPVFGWVRWDDDADDYGRVVTECYVDVARKQGKSSLAGGVAIYLTCGDGEPGAQVVAAATTRDQAGYVFAPVKQLVEQSPALRKHVKALQTKIVHKRTGSYFETVSSLAEATHGANIHGGIVDELHLHKSPDLVEAIETGTGSRRQPLIFLITTADEGKRETVYARKRERVERLARGSLKLPSVYGVVWAADESDDPHTEATWRKANPGYGVSPTRRFMREASEKAQESPVDLASFQRLHLGIRTKQKTRYVDLADWDANAGLVVASALAGRAAFGGLDLASTSDLTALCWVFPDKAGGFDVLTRLWTPEDNLPALDRRTANLASVWVRQGHLVATPGNIMDYDFIAAQIALDMKAFRVREVAFDPWNSTQLVTNLTNDGAPMVAMRQGFASMSGPTKDFHRMLRSGTVEAPVIRHGGNPVMRWMADNLAVAMDPAGNVKPDRANSGDKIDGIVALIMALSRATALQKRTSTPGIRYIG